MSSFTCPYNTGEYKMVALTWMPIVVRRNEEEEEEAVTSNINNNYGRRTKRWGSVFTEETHQVITVVAF